MEITSKVTSFNVTAEELKDIRAAYEKMVAGLDFEKMINAMRILEPNCKTILSKELLKQSLDESYEEVMDSWGPCNEDGSLDIEIRYWSFVVGAHSYMLRLNLGEFIDDWHWILTLDTAYQYVYPEGDEA